VTENHGASEVRGLVAAAVLVAALIGFAVGYNAGAKVAEGVVRAAVTAADDEILASSYAPIVAASITGGCAILCAIMLPVVTLVTLHRLEKDDS